jgi:hypothetical protein
MPRDHVRIIIMRSLKLSKTYILLSIALAINGLVVSPFGSILARGSSLLENLDSQISLPMISIPILAISTMTLTIPVILLFVYDKNNGVLERFLSLGLNQADIYKRYLKASLWLALTFLPIIIILYVAIGSAVGIDLTLLLKASGVLVLLALSVVTLLAMSMMAFSSLQKQRVGANQPLGLGIGGLVVIPYYIIPIVFPRDAIFIELGVALVIGAVSIALLILSSKLISREKLLP